MAFSSSNSILSWVHSSTIGFSNFKKSILKSLSFSSFFFSKASKESLINLLISWAKFFSDSEKVLSCPNVSIDNIKVFDSFSKSCKTGFTNFSFSSSSPSPSPPSFLSSSSSTSAPPSLFCCSSSLAAAFCLSSSSFSAFAFSYSSFCCWYSCRFLIALNKEL